MPNQTVEDIKTDIETAFSLGAHHIAIYPFIDFTFTNSKVRAMEKRENFLGFGCSATTLLRNHFKINTFSVAEYQQRIAGDNLPTSLTLRFTKRQRMIYYLFWTAYSTQADAGAFQRFFGE